MAAEAVRKAPSKLQVALALGAVYILWGSTYLGMRIAVETIPPFWMAGFRYGLAGLLLYGWARWRGAPRPEWRHWKSALVIGGLLLMVGNGGVVWAEQKVASGLASLLVATEALWIVLLQWGRRGGVRPGWRTLTGVALGFVGLGILVGPGAGGGLDWTGTVALLIAAFSWAVGSLYAQKAPMPESPLLATGLQMLAGGGLLILAGLVTGEAGRLDPSQISSESIFAVLYLLLFGSLIGFTAYSWLLRNVSPTLASTYAYINPVVAVFLGWALAEEPVTAMTIVAAAVIVSGVALITSASGSGHESVTPQKREELREEQGRQETLDRKATTGSSPSPRTGTRQPGEPLAARAQVAELEEDLEPQTCGAR